MSKRTFKPLPQTVREAQGQLFTVSWQLASLCHGPDIRSRWSEVPVPVSDPEFKHLIASGKNYANRLSKQDAEKLINWWINREGCGVFEFKMEPVCS